MPRLLLPLFLLLSAIAAALTSQQGEKRAIEVLFFGSPKALGPWHDPITRYEVIQKNLADDGVNFTYCEDPAVALSPDTLKKYDALLMYANWEKKNPMPADQLKALLEFVDGGKGFLPIHCASASYGGSPEFLKLVGARFKVHTSAVFEPKTVKPDHPTMVGLPPLNAWDETYVHDTHGDDRTILQTREDEPWTWVRNQGKGRVFYTASGHDHRVWDRPEFHELIKRAVHWAAGDLKK